jgi:hypothetical protein
MVVAFDQQSLATLLVGASAKLDVLWQIFIALHFGIFTLFMINRVRMKPLGKVLAMSGYIVVLGVNYGALAGTYRNLDGLQQQLRKDYAANTEVFSPDLYKSFVSAEFSGRQALLYGTHGAALIFVMLLIWAPKWLVHDASELVAESE